MDDDEPPPRKSYPLSPSKLSKTPSWIMLGFILGAAFVAALPPFKKKAAPLISPVERPAVRPVPERAKPKPPQLTTIEAVFEVWGRYAVWSDDITEVALWSREERAFSDFYEVRRMGKVYYFRTIPTLTRRMLTHGVPMPKSPLQFTETEEQYREWVEYGRSEATTVAPVDRIIPPEQTRPRLEPALPPVDARTRK